MSQNQLGVSTETNAATNQFKANVEDKIYLLEPQETPFTEFMQLLGDKNPGGAKFSHFEDDLCADTDEITNNAGTGATLAVAHVEYHAIGDLIYVPSTGELCRVSAAVTGTGAGNLTVVRGVGAGGAVATDGSGTAVPTIIISAAFMQGAGLPEAKFKSKDEVENYTQIVKTVLPGITNTAEASKQNTEDEWNFQKRKYAVEQAFKIEKLSVLGQKGRNVSGNHPLYTTGGLVERISTNVLLGVGSLSEGKLDNLLYKFLSYGSLRRKYFFVSPLIHRAISQFAKARGQVLQGTKKYGVSISDYEVAGGLVKVVMHPRLLSGALGGWAFGADLDNCQIRTLRKTKFFDKTQANDEDQKAGYYLTEVGFSWKHEKTHCLMTGVTGISSTSSS
jgi:hypothetical protein